MIEIKHMKLIQSLAKHGSLSAAARELGYSQPAVTQQIQKLEASLRTPLFIRTSKGVRLTGAGEVLLRHSHTVLPIMSLARAEVDAVARLRSGKVRVASFATAAATLIPQAFAAVTAQHPDIRFTLVEALPTAALEMMRNGDCDLALVYHYSTGDSFDNPVIEEVGEEVVTELMEENVYIALPESHPAATRRTVKLGELRDERWIAGCPSCRGNLVNACEMAGFEPKISFETDDYVALHSLVAADLGVAMISDLMLSAVRSNSSVHLRRMATAPLRTISAVSTRSMLKVPGVALTLKTLQSVARNLELIEVP